MPTRILHRIRRLPRDRRGNILMLFGLSLVPVTFATGMAIDYGSAMRLQTRLNAAADAAALAATSSAMMDRTVAEAAAQARVIFRTQVEGTPGLTKLNFLDPKDFKVEVTEATTAKDGTIRTANVSYRGESLNNFAAILGQDTLTIKGTAVAKASTAPDIDFYIMMDMSPSMALPITTAGLKQLRDITGCAFACHSTNDKTAKAKDGTQKDYYGVAQSYNIPLRVDAEKLAVQNMTNAATSASAATGAKYRMSVSTFHVKGQFKTIANLDDSFATVRTAAGNAKILQVYSNNFLTKTLNNEDTDTAYTDMFDQAMTLMPNPPGNGMRSPGSRPQAVMMIITDGMRDEDVGGRKLIAMPTAQCDTIKSRGIRIAILYTEYLKESMDGDSWSQTNVVPNLWKVAPALQNCASPGLFSQVTTDGDISEALNNLFQKSISTSRLTR